jgi:anti-anti-sigma factor
VVVERGERGPRVRSTQSTLAVDALPDGPTVRVRLDGELDVTSSPLLQAVIDQALAARREPLCQRLVVDMSGVVFADASGMSPLLMARALLARRGGAVELHHCRRAVLRLLRLLDVLDLVADAAEDAGPAAEAAPEPSRSAGPSTRHPTLDATARLP